MPALCMRERRAGSVRVTDEQQRLSGIIGTKPTIALGVLSRQHILSLIVTLTDADQCRREGHSP